MKNLEINISKPSKLKLISTLFLSLVYSKKKNKVINRVGNYRLQNKVIKENGYYPYFYGIYIKKGKKYFIKTWSGKIHDFNYQLLINELIVNKVLYNRLFKGKFRTPKIIEYISTKNSLSVVYEYIEGKSLLAYPLSKQSQVIALVMKYFKEISNTPKTRKHLSNLERKDKMYYLNSLNFLTIMSLISSPKNASLVVKGYLKALKNYLDLKNSNLVINHCDLNPDNILISNGRYYIIDCGRVSLTIPGYDLTYVSLNPSFSKLAIELSKKIGNSENQFLKIYLSIQNLKLKDPKSGKFNYLNSLQEVI